MKLALIILGIVCFVVDAFKPRLAPNTPVNFFSLGWAFIAAAVLLPIP
jgi:hypothetical protein